MAVLVVAMVTCDACNNTGAGLDTTSEYASLSVDQSQVCGCGLVIVWLM